MKIGLFGGTFNPPHQGHLLIAQQILDFTECEQVWFVPGYTHTFHKESVSPEHRLLMVEKAIQDHQEFCLSRLEVDNQLDGHTINLLPLLPQEHSYSFVIGSDQLPAFHLWGEWERLLQEMPFLIFPRYGYPNEPLHPGMTMIHDESLIVSNISSTKIRDRVKRGLSVAKMVPVEVEKYIISEKLYTE